MNPSTLYKLEHKTASFHDLNYQSRIDETQALSLAKKILAEIMCYRRLASNAVHCQHRYCVTCDKQFLPIILQAVKNNRPLHCVLPAFPGKSPNPEKVLGFLPDLGEELALDFLNNLCELISQIYPPGMKIILCSDGRVFSDIVGIKEQYVTAYQLGLMDIIQRKSLKNITTYNLDDYYEDDYNFGQMRDELMKRFGQSLDFLKDKIKRGSEVSAKPDEKTANRLYRGITRFLFEDASFQTQLKSRTQIQKESKVKAYELIRRSNAWSELLQSVFPNALRLSIHPQACGSTKLGIVLIGNESWLTPWHGVIGKTHQGYVLLKRSQAEMMGAKLIYAENGQPSYYELKAELA